MSLTTLPAVTNEAGQKVAAQPVIQVDASGDYAGGGGGGGGDASAANQVALAALIGEVAANPTANSVLDRLKAIVTAITAQSGYVDGLEALATTLNGYVDGLEALAAAATPAGTNLIGKVGIDQTTDGTTNKVNIDASLKSGTATRSSVNSGTSSVTILASNAARKGGTIFNSDANALLLDLSAGTAAAARCQVRLTQYQSYEVGSGYTGAITGIWEADGSGVADISEFT